MMMKGALTMTEIQNSVERVAIGVIRAALAERMLTWVALVAGIGFAGYAMVNPEPLRLYCAAGYAGLVFWPVLFKQGRNNG